MDHMKPSITIQEHDYVYGNTCSEGYTKETGIVQHTDSIISSQQHRICICIKCLKQLNTDCIENQYKLKWKRPCQMTNFGYLKREYLRTLLFIAAFAVLPSLSFDAQSCVSWSHSLLCILLFCLLQCYMTILFLTALRHTYKNKNTKLVVVDYHTTKILARKEDYIEIQISRKNQDLMTVSNYPIRTWLHFPWSKEKRKSFHPKKWKSSSVFNSKFWLIAILLTGTLLRMGDCEEIRNSSTDPHLSGYFTTRPPQERECSKTELFCDHFSLDSLLDNDELQQCTGENRTSHCCSPILRIFELDRAGKGYMDMFSLMLGKYATVTSYSLQWSIQRCKVAYKNWICSMQHRYFSSCPSGTRSHIPPCQSICTYVERSCPFFRVHNFTKLYGGQSTFLCNGADDSQATSNATCYNLDDMTRPNYPDKHLPETSDENSCMSRDQSVRLERKAAMTTGEPEDEITAEGSGNITKRSQNSSSSAAMSIFNSYSTSLLLNLCFLIILNSDILLIEWYAAL